MPEKSVPETKIAVRPFDQSRDVRDRRAPIIGKLHHPDHWMQGGEGIRRHFGMRRRDSSQERRFSGIWITYETGVRDRAQLENESRLLALPPLGVLARRPIARTLEMDIPFPAFAPVTENEFFV